MNEQQMRALKALLDGNPAAQGEIESMISKYTASATKTAEAAGLRFKDDGIATKIAEMEAQIAALKAMAESKAEDKPAAAAEVVEAEAEGDDGEEEAMDYAGDMSVGDFKALVAEAVKVAMGGMASEMKALNTRLNMAEKMGAMMEEMKGYMSGTSQKDASRAEQIEALQAALTETQTRVKTLTDQLSELLGDQPAAVASESGRTVAAVETPDKFEVTKKSGAPAYSHPADAIGAWVEGLTS